MRTTDPFVSVVTPVYNTAEYLAACIESVLEQDHRNFEYIIANNCSTDESLAIAQDYASRDSRIRVMNSSRFLGQVENYNHALRQISPQAKYCKMVQADDWIFPSCLSEMIDVAERDSEVAIVGAYQLSGAEVRCEGLVCQGPLETYSIVSGSDACRLYLLERRYLFGTPTSVMYTAELVRSRHDFFQHTSYHEDSEVCFEVLATRKFGFVHKILTFTRTDNESLSTSVQTYGPDLLHAFIIVERFGPQYLSAAELKASAKKASDDLYSFLATCMFKRRGERFWEYHRKGAKAAGTDISRLRLWVMQAPRFARWIGNPVRVVERVAQVLTRRSAR